MSDDRLVESILYEISKHLDDDILGYSTLKTEYWFGRLCSSTELKNCIIALIEEHSDDA